MRTLPRLRDGLAQIKHYRNSTFGPLNQYPSFGSSVSDLFVGREGLFRTRFHGENSLALVYGRRIPVEHLIVLIDCAGAVITQLKVMSDDFRISIDLPSTGHEFYSFIHLSVYSEMVLKPIASDERLITRNHRGYTGYLMRDSLVESTVHGNFGLVYLGKNGSLRSLARQKSVHRYTVQELFNEAFRYDLCFPNPTARSLRMDVDVVDEVGSIRETVSQVIPPFGNWMLRLDGKRLRGGCYLSWRSRLPVGRCIIFEIDEQRSTCNVFHS